MHTLYLFISKFDHNSLTRRFLQNAFKHFDGFFFSSISYQRPHSVQPPNRPNAKHILEKAVERRWRWGHFQKAWLLKTLHDIIDMHRSRPFLHAQTWKHSILEDNQQVRNNFKQKPVNLFTG